MHKNRNNTHMHSTFCCENLWWSGPKRKKKKLRLSMSFVILGHVQTNFDFVYLLITRSISEDFLILWKKQKTHIGCTFPPPPPSFLEVKLK